MKKLNFLKSVCLICFICFSLLAKAQPPYWKLGGNPLLGPDGLNTTNNQLGTAAGNNIPINVITNGINRFLINNGGTTSTDGRVAMGNNLPIGFTP